MEEDKKIEVSERQLNDLLAQNKILMEKNSELAEGGEDKGKVEAPTEITDRTVSIVFVDDKPVQAFKNRGTKERPAYVYEKPNPENPKEMILFVDALFPGEPDAVPLAYNDLLREGLRENCAILKVEATPWTIGQGKTTKKMVNNYAMEETGVVVPMEVKGTTSVFTVQLPNGDTMDVHENFVNI